MRLNEAINQYSNFDLHLRLVRGAAVLEKKHFLAFPNISQYKSLSPRGWGHTLP